MGYRLNRLDESVFMAGPKPMQTEFGIHQRLESCVTFQYCPLVDRLIMPGRNLLECHFSSK